MELEKVYEVLPENLIDINRIGNGLSGLKNLGNTCYLNVAVQCLSHTLPLTEYLLRGNYKKYLAEHVDKDGKLPEEINLLTQYMGLLCGIWEKGLGEDDSVVDEINYVITPRTFVLIFTKFFPEGGIFRQNDSQESIIYLLDTFHELISRPVSYNITGVPHNEFEHKMVKSISDWAKHFKNKHSHLLEIFYGQEHLRIQCLNEKCEKITNNFPPFQCVCLPINKSTKTIYDCFDLHCKAEQLDKENKWECDHCHTKSQAYKKTTYWKLPQTLMISFNRFQVRPDYGFVQRQQHVKNDKLIEYPLINLDLRNYLTNHEESYMYDLHAVCCHVGNTYGGHYYCYCLNKNGHWYCFNDDVVKRITNLQEIVSDDAYILFYHKREVSESRS